MKRLFKYFIFSISLTLLFAHHLLFAQPTHTLQQNAVTKKKNNSYRFTLTGEIKPSCLLFQDNTFKHIFGHANFMIGAEAGCSMSRFFHLFAEIEYLYANGHTQTEQIPTSLQIMPVSIGFKGVYPINSIVDLYAKLGPNWIYVKEISDYQYFQHNDHKDTFGVTSGTGLIVHVLEKFSLDFFTHYIYGKKHYTDQYSNTKIKRYFGGFQLGIGLAFSY